jgi:threonine/homoserine/homoserine lactone efflux protein
MTEWLALLGVWGALGLGVMSPGPSFILVARVAVARSRRQALACALGMGVGGLVFAAAALAGLQAVFRAVPLLYLLLKVVGGAYLLYLGWQIVRQARQPLRADEGGAGSAPAGRSGHGFWLGLATQLANPKTAIVYASVFAAFLPAQFSAAFAALLLLAVFAIEALWYALVALLLSSPAPQRAYLRWKTRLDRAAGLALGALGLRLLWTARDAPA